MKNLEQTPIEALPNSLQNEEELSTQLYNFIELVLIPQQVIPKDLTSVFETLRCTIDHRELVRQIWAKYKVKQELLDSNEPEFEFYANMIARAITKYGALNFKSQDLAEKIQKKKNRTKKDYERAQKLRLVLKEWLLKTSDPSSNSSENEMLDRIFSYLEMEEELLGTQITLLVLFTFCRKYQNQKKDETTIVVGFINSFSSVCDNLRFGMEFKKLLNSKKISSTRDDADSFSVRSPNIPNEARPLRLLHLALHKPRKLTKNIQGYIDDEGQFKKEHIIFLSKINILFHTKGFDYLEDYFGFLTNDEIIDCMFYFPHQKTYYGLCHLYSYLQVGLTPGDEKIINQFGGDIKQGILATILFLKSTGVVHKLKDINEFSQDDSQLLTIPENDQKILKIWSPLFDSKHQMNNAYDHMTELVPYVDKDVIRLMTIGLHSNQSSNKFNEFANKYPDYFIGDTNIENLFRNSFEQQVKLGFFQLTYVAHYLTFIKTHMKEDFNDWFMKQIRESFKYPSEERSSKTGNILILLDHLEQHNLAEVFDLLFAMISSWSAPLVNFILNKCTKYCLSRKFSPQIVEQIFFIAFKKNIDTAYFIRNSYQHRDKDTGIKISDVSTKSRYLLFFSAISQGSHLFTDFRIRSRIVINNKQYNSDSPISTIFSDFMDIVVSEPEFAVLFPAQLFERNQILEYRDSELGSIEAFAAVLAIYLKNPIDVSDVSTLIILTRKVALRMLSLPDEYLKLFDKLKKKRERESIYFLAISLYKLGISFKEFSPEIIEKYWFAFQNSTVYSLLNFFSDLRNALLLDTDPKYLLAHLSKMLQRSKLNGDELLLYTKSFLDRTISNNFKKIFQINVSTNFAEDISVMVNKWGGNIEPLILAASRLKSSPEFSEDLLVLLGEIVAAELTGNFSILKYEGKGSTTEDSAKRQLAKLSDSERILWKSNPSELRVVRTKNDTESTNTIFELQFRQASDHFYDQVINQGHGKLFDQSERKNSNYDTKSVVEKLKTLDFGDKNVSSLINKIFFAESIFLQLPKINRAEFCLRALTDLIHQNTDSLDLQPLILQLAIYIKNDYFSSLNGKDVLNDLTVLVKKLTPVKEKKRDFVLFTTIADSLRILIDLGDLVEDGSCLSLLRGVYAYTVIALVLDAHSKVCMSFEIIPDMLNKNPQKAELIMKQIEQGEILTEFDQNSLTLVLKDSKREEIIAKIVFTKGVARKIVRVGATAGRTPKAYVTSEMTYRSKSHPEIDKALTEIIEKIGIPVLPAGDEMYIEDTRSPSGAYSDKKGGLMKDGYYVKGG